MVQSWRAGDAMLLVMAARADSCTEQSFDELEAMLRERRFLRAVQPVEGDLLQELAALCQRSGLGCRVALESEWLGRRPARFMSCAAHAHLAFALVVERSRNFEAHALGRMTSEAERRVVLLDGLPFPE